MAKVTGIGGIFFKSKNPQQTKEWYAENLGLNTDKYGTNFEWYQGADSRKKGFTQWSPFNANTQNFGDSGQQFMVNYRVDDLTEMVAELKKNGVTVLDKIEEFSYGKFVHILDSEGIKIQLWEPNDEAYDKIVEGRTK